MTDENKDKELVLEKLRNIIGVQTKSTKEVELVLDAARLMDEIHGWSREKWHKMAYLEARIDRLENYLNIRSK